MRLSWDDVGSRTVGAGIEKGVFYPAFGPGVSWNGLTSINETVDNDTQLVTYSDGEKQVNQMDLGDFSATVEAFTYPDEFEFYDGYTQPMYSGQPRSQFGLSYKASLFDSLGNVIGYRLHLVYNCLVKPTTRDDETISDSPDVQSFSWDLTTSPVAFPYDRPTAHIYLDSTSVLPADLEAIETILYGQDNGQDPRLPSIVEVLTIFEANALFIVFDNGDGTATVTGSDEAVYQDEVDPTKWTFDYVSVVQESTDIYRASSY